MVFEGSLGLERLASLGLLLTFESFDLVDSNKTALTPPAGRTRTPSSSLTMYLPYQRTIPLFSQSVSRGSYRALGWHSHGNATGFGYVDYDATPFMG